MEETLIEKRVLKEVKGLPSELIEDKRKAVLKFFGIWKDMSHEEKAVLKEISLRRQINLMA